MANCNLNHILAIFKHKLATVRVFTFSLALHHLKEIKHNLAENAEINHNLAKNSGRPFGCGIHASTNLWSDQSAVTRFLNTGTFAVTDFKYGIARKECNKVNVEIDHLVPLEDGGTNDISNLWAQPRLPRPAALDKDILENKIKREVCAGRMDLPTAQHRLMTDWYAFWIEVVQVK